MKGLIQGQAVCQGALLVGFSFLSLLPAAEGRACQIRNFAGEAVDFYWMDVVNWGKYVKQNKRPLTNATSMPLKTFETHRFFAAWADEANDVPLWDPDQIPASLQFVHRGYDQVVTALVDENGNLFVEDWDALEGEVAAVTKLVDGCSSEDVDSYAECIIEKAGDRVGRVEKEVEWTKEQSQRMQRRLDESFCGNGQFHSPALRTLTWSNNKPKVQVDVLLDTEDVTIYHLKGLLDKGAVDALLKSKPDADGGDRHREVVPGKGLGWDPLTKLAERSENFVKQILKDQVAGDKPVEPLRIFRYGEKESHVPPCDGICPLLSRNVSDYMGTFIAYAKVPSSGGAWRFEAADGSVVGFVPKVHDAVFFHYKRPEGYTPSILPKLVPCALPGTGKDDAPKPADAKPSEELVTVTRWIPRKALHEAAVNEL